jgi:transposase
VNLAGPALADIPVTVDVPWGVPVLTDRAYDSDPLRADLGLGGFRLLARHRANRSKPPVNDGRRLRRLKRRWVVERSFAWLGRSRRNSRDDERSTGSGEAMIQASSIHCMLRLLKPDWSKKPVPFKDRELQGNVTG